MCHYHFVTLSVTTQPYLSILLLSCPAGTRLLAKSRLFIKDRLIAAVKAEYQTAIKHVLALTGHGCQF